MRGLTHAERAVVTALNAHITRNEEVSLTELAQECHVAKSTVVKTLQRLGYQGFEEFRYNYRLSRDAQRGTLPPRVLTVGDEGQLVEGLAQLLLHCEGKKGIVFCDGKRLNSLLARYVARKLAFFDIFAPSSYDYAMVTESTMEPGVAMFFFHREPREFEEEGVGESMVQTVRERGYRTVVFTDRDESNDAAKADLLLRVSDNSDASLDLFATKVIMLVERALARLAQLRGGDAREHAGA